MEVPMIDKNDPRIDLADRLYELTLVVIPLLTAIIELISKVVNYARLFSELRVQVPTERKTDFCAE
jgi:hypothetical protein